MKGSLDTIALFVYPCTQTTGDVAEQYHVHLFMSRHQIRQGNYKEAEVHAHQACQFDGVSSSSENGLLVCGQKCTNYVLYVNCYELCDWSSIHYWFVVAGKDHLAGLLLH